MRVGGLRAARGPDRPAAGARLGTRPTMTCARPSRSTRTRCRAAGGCAAVQLQRARDGTCSARRTTTPWALDGAFRGAPAAGFFCAGKTAAGPRSFVHGFTATVAVFAGGKRQPVSSGDRAPAGVVRVRAGTRPHSPSTGPTPTWRRAGWWTRGRTTRAHLGAVLSRRGRLDRRNRPHARAPGPRRGRAGAGGARRRGAGGAARGRGAGRAVQRGRHARGRAGPRLPAARAHLLQWRHRARRGQRLRGLRRLVDCPRTSTPSGGCGSSTSR